MTELLTAAQMRALERAAMDSGRVTGLELMERAGRGVVEAILDWRPNLACAPHRAVVLCGPGNNGGDGFVVARLLAQRGWDVEVYLFGDAAKLPPDAARNYDRWRAQGDVRPLQDLEGKGYPSAGDGVSIVVDALLGSGVTRPFQDFGAVQEHLNHLRLASEHDPALPGVVAVDVPSGLSSDTGHFPRRENSNPLDACFLANLTVTFHSPYLGHYLNAGPAACGTLVTKDIGLAPWSKDHRGVALTPNPPAPMAPGPRRAARKSPSRHKYGHGHAVVLSGPQGKTGAARLAARGALRIGAGLVTLASPACAMPENAAHVTAIMLEQIEDADALDGLLTDARLNALCLGPGLGRGARTRALVRAALAARRATVLDADALTSFAGNPSALFERLHTACVLTPHDGEFKRLFPDIAKNLDPGVMPDPAYTKIDAARAAAARAGCTILLKGPGTVIADQSGNVTLNSALYDRAAPWLATAGSGDVLAGFITGLLARGFAPACAAQTAAWLHVEAARRFGPGLIAEDLPEELPKVFEAQLS